MARQAALAALMLAAGCTGAGPSSSDLPSLEIPVRGVEHEDLRDSFTDVRGGHTHHAIDIMAARRTPVVAADDGVIVKLFTSSLGGLTVYQRDPTETWVYSYAHLHRLRRGLHEGEKVRCGQVIAYVGSSGNAPDDTPHLHFAVARLGPERRWWAGTPVNPFPLFSP